MSKKPERNMPCPCDSGRKYKLCHGALGRAHWISVRFVVDDRGEPPLMLTTADGQLTFVPTIEEGYLDGWLRPWEDAWASGIRGEELLEADALERFTDWAQIGAPPGSGEFDGVEYINVALGGGAMTIGLPQSRIVSVSARESDGSDSRASSS